ncbi:hypothetical protein OTU49_011791 [Cherax quadricarinatus]|uniref:Uncharacterized protein n=1 Tax=Cherax quadricarinatus TaxID=27406 RepID=A0AAW0W325_CHEQU
MSSPLEQLCNFPNFTQQAYRYGIALSCIGVLLNWLGVAQAHIEAVRYLGVALVIVGSFLIIAAMCRWMFLSPQSTIVSEVPSERVGDLHVITVPMGGIQGPPCVQGPLCAPGAATTTQGKPPDYFLVVEKPPSYEEAMSMLLPYAATSSSSWHLSASGLEDFLAPNQVPGSQVDGTTSASPHNCQGGSECLPEVLLPPAYSSQMSPSASASMGNGDSCLPLEDIPRCPVTTQAPPCSDAPQPNPSTATAEPPMEIIKLPDKCHKTCHTPPPSQDHIDDK